MPRVRKGAARSQARKRILRKARGFYGVNHLHKYRAEYAVIRAGCYAYRDRTAGESSRDRVLRAALGGVLMGAGARLAHGCTSGLGLTGGALLNTGAWLFIPVAFGTAFLAAAMLRRATPAATS